MWATYPSRSRHPRALARDNAPNTANWAITMPLGIVHLIVTIAGTVIGATRVFRGPGIPFLRPGAPQAAYQGLGVR